MIDFILIGVMLLMVVMALGELGAIFPSPVPSLPTRPVSSTPAVGFAMAYNYWLQWLIVLPLELVAASSSSPTGIPTRRCQRVFGLPSS